MNLKEDDFKNLVDIAVEACKTAGVVVNNYRFQKHNINLKSEVGNIAAKVVTKVDRLSQDKILEFINPTLEVYDLGILLEEDNDDGSRLIKDYFWCIDPLDGTLPYIEGRDGFSISIALVSRTGEPIIGVVYDPVKKDLYHAVKGLGAFKNNCLLSKEVDRDSITVIYDRSFLTGKYYNKTLSFIKSLSLKYKYRDIKHIDYGGAVLNALWTINNSPGIYIKYPKQTKGGGSLWDFAASTLIVKEAGGVATDIYANNIELNRKDSTFLNHKGVIICSHDFIKSEFISFYKSLMSE